MANEFEEYHLALSPGWMQKTLGAWYQRMLGRVKDGLVQRARSAVKARVLGQAPGDALVYLGSERGLTRAPGETDTQWTARVQSAWQTWPYAGTAQGMLNAFNVLGYSNVTIRIQNGVDYSLDGSGNLVVQAVPTPVHLGGVPELWNQFAVLFTPTLPAAWLSSMPGNGSDEVNLIRGVINKWKPGHAQLIKIVAITGHVWGWPVTQVWGQASLVWGGTVTTWTPS